MKMLRGLNKPLRAWSQMASKVPKSVQKRAAAYARRAVAHINLGPFGSAVAYRVEEAYIKGWDSGQKKFAKNQRYRWIVYCTYFGYMIFNGTEQAAEAYRVELANKYQCIATKLHTGFSPHADEPDGPGLVNP